MAGICLSAYILKDVFSFVMLEVKRKENVETV